MARRYCGQVNVYIAYRDTNQDFQCSVIGPDGARVIYVGERSFNLEHAVDSPEMYDQVAHAAISFAADEDEQGKPDLKTGCWDMSTLNYVEINPEACDGWLIRRKR